MMLDVPDPIDRVIISIREDLLPCVIKVCGETGIDFCIVHSADFHEITEMDLNPVFAYPKGQAPAAVDVRVKVG